MERDPVKRGKHLLTSFFARSRKSADWSEKNELFYTNILLHFPWKIGTKELLGIKMSGNAAGNGLTVLTEEFGHFPFERKCCATDKRIHLDEP